jgi:large subunit ribosomal protein L20
MPRAKRGNKRLEKRQKNISLSQRLLRKKIETYRRKRSGRAFAEFRIYGTQIEKRDFRRLWIVRINAACRLNEMKYSQLCTA